MGNSCIKFWNNNNVGVIQDDDTDRKVVEYDRRLSRRIKLNVNQYDNDGKQIQEQNEGDLFLETDTERKKSDPAPQYQNLFSKPPDIITIQPTSQSDSDQEQSTPGRSIPDGCEMDQPQQPSIEKVIKIETKTKILPIISLTKIPNETEDSKLEKQPEEGFHGSEDVVSNVHAMVESNEPADDVSIIEPLNDDDTVDVQSTSNLSISSTEIKANASHLVSNAIAAAMVRQAEVKQFDSHRNKAKVSRISPDVSATKPIKSNSISNNCLNKNDTDTEIGENKKTAAFHSDIHSDISLGFSISSSSFIKAALDQIHEEKKNACTIQNENDNCEIEKVECHEAKGSEDGKVCTSNDKDAAMMPSTASERETEITVETALIQAPGAVSNSSVDAELNPQLSEKPPISTENKIPERPDSSEKGLATAEYAIEKSSENDIEDVRTLSEIKNSVDASEAELTNLCSFDNNDKVSVDCFHGDSTNPGKFMEDDQASISSSILDMQARSLVFSTLDRIASDLAA